ncbi:MAG: T9SS type A sorting domain-containing protein [Sphingobacteriales bacterium JAD_PAG50586_3]|nr:MAG: T9SS type A sorting domain-containing protein [Sphingobacteriales bacterium JAD_PAG50586_3]
MKHFFIAALFFSCSALVAQVPKKIIVEHFTNTKCSICASKNPGFYTNLSNHPGVLHLAIHPSSPYTACLLSQQSLADSDARTNYYGLYGSTPKFVINGADIPTSTNYASAELFNPFEGQTSPLSISIKQYKYGNDSIKSTITIKAIAAHSYTNLKLFAALAEDTINYTSQNGETRHYDVFRKALWGAEGTTIAAPANIGDSVVYTTRTAANPVWNFSRIYTLALLQLDDTKEVVQAEAIPATQQNNDVATTINDLPVLEANIFPNPTKGLLNIQLATTGLTNLLIIAADGKVIANTSFSQHTAIDLTGLPTGLYSVMLSTGNARTTKRIVIQ